MKYSPFHLFIFSKTLFSLESSHTLTTPTRARPPTLSTSPPDGTHVPGDGPTDASSSLTGHSLH